MKGARWYSREWIRDLRVVWVFLAAMTAVLLAFTAASIANYGSVAQAHALASVELGYQVRYLGTNATGAVGNNGTVAFTLMITVLNPSPRVLDFDSISYKVWIEDGPAEAGIPNLGRADQVLVNGSVNHLFYMALFGSLEVSPVPIPAGGQRTLPLPVNLSVGASSTEFAVVQNITAYAAAHGTALGAIPWVSWVQLGLPIEGVPSPSLSAPTYEFEVGRVVISGGIDLGSVGGGTDLV